jgi:hypothetical protein
MVLLYVNEELAGTEIAGARRGFIRDTGALPTCGIVPLEPPK